MKGKQVLLSYEETGVYFRKSKKDEPRHTGKLRTSCSRKVKLSRGGLSLGVKRKEVEQVGCRTLPMAVEVVACWGL